MAWNLRDVARAIWRDTEPMNIFETEKILLDFRFYSEDTSCVVCKYPFCQFEDLNKEFSRERRESDSYVGKDGSFDWCPFGASEECARRYGTAVHGGPEGFAGCACGVRAERSSE